MESSSEITQPMIKVIKLSSRFHRQVNSFYRTNCPRNQDLIEFYHADFWKWILQQECFIVIGVTFNSKIIALVLFQQKPLALIKRIISTKLNDKPDFVEYVDELIRSFIPSYSSNKPLIVKEFTIPINVDRLIKHELIDSDSKLPYIPLNNPLRLITKADIPSITSRLLTKYPFFDDDTVQSSLLSRKNIVYSFCNQDCLEFISVYQHYVDFTEVRLRLRVAVLGFYYSENDDINKLLSMLIGKLYDYGFDMLVIQQHPGDDFASTIDTTKYESELSKQYYSATGNPCSVWPFMR
jgi:hypothetical protein